MHYFTQKPHKIFRVWGTARKCTGKSLKLKIVVVERSLKSRQKVLEKSFNFKVTEKGMPYTRLLRSVGRPNKARQRPKPYHHNRMNEKVFYVMIWFGLVLGWQFQ